MQGHHRIRARRLGAILALILAPYSVASADVDDRESPRRAAEIIASIDEPGGQPSWTSHFRLAKKHGVKFKRKLTVGDQRVIFSVHGPVLTRKSLGLGFELKF